MKLFVANFDDDTTEEELDELFRRFGKVRDVSIFTDWDTGKSRGFGFVEFDDAKDAEKAIEELDSRRWNGMHLKVKEARPKSERRTSTSWREE
jgi:RNA recognition motif-containing protein